MTRPTSIRLSDPEREALKAFAARHGMDQTTAIKVALELMYAARPSAVTAAHEQFVLSPLAPVLRS